jgi:isoquinoline 1-oxidoreductase subunit beta
VQDAFGSYLAQVVEVEATDGQVHVQRVVCAVDCGININPDTIRAQIEGGILMGGLLGVSFQTTFKSLTNKVGTF